MGLFTAVLMFLSVVLPDLPGSASFFLPALIIGLGAATLLHGKPYLPILMAAAAYGLSLVFTKDPLLSADMLRFVPCAVLMAVLMARGADRVTAIWATAALCLAAILIPMAISIHGQYGGLSVDVLTSFFDELRAAFLEAYHLAIETNGSDLPEEILSGLTDDVFHSVFDMILSLLPALLVILACAIAFAAHLLALMICRSTGYANKMPPNAQLFAMSKISAVIFILAFLLSFVGLGSSDSGMAIAVSAENLRLMLTPAFLVVGILGVFGFIRRQRGCLNGWVLLAMIFILPYFIAVLITPLAVLGVILTLMRPGRIRPNS